MSEEVKIDGKAVAKIGTKEEAAWTKIKDQALELVEEGSRNVLINLEIIKLAERMIEYSK